MIEEQTTSEVTADRIGALSVRGELPDFELPDHVGNRRRLSEPSRLISISVDPPEANAAFRAGLGARWTFLPGPQRETQAQLRLRETTDTLNNPYVPAVL